MFYVPFPRLPQWLERAIAVVEHGMFGVCSFLGDFMGISSAKIRLFFIYASFLAKGSPVLVYLALGFLLNLKKYFTRGRTGIYD